MSTSAQHTINWIEQGYIPDSIIRKGIRRLLKERLKEIAAEDIEQSIRIKQQFINSLCNAPIALSPEKANEQHYEVPAEFYERVLGHHRKYSCCYWDKESSNLNSAENNALKQTCNHANIVNGQDILELGCGWGSLTLWMAEHFPDSHITAVSNSNSQRDYIEQLAAKMGLKNIQVITCDMNDYQTSETFDRIVSIEMFEHMRNWQQLFKHISQWLKPDGQFFMHVFTHRTVPYAFEAKDSSDWMSEYFFTGGMMPSSDMASHFQDHLQLTNSWAWNGNHYAKTANAWLKNMDKQKDSLMPLINSTYNHTMVQTWWMRWRIFFMACEELFAFDNGQQWYVMHYLFNKRTN